MKPPLNSSAALVAVSLLLVSCNTSDDKGSSIALDDLVAQRANAVCSLFSRCCPESFDSAAFSDCVTANTSSLSSLPAEIRVSEAAGRSRYDDEAAAACIAATEATSCGDYFANANTAVKQACDSVVVPLVPASGACDQGWECIGGSCIDAICVTKPGGGFPCDNMDCAAGFNCESGLCVALKADLTECNYASECQSGVCDVGASGTCIAWSEAQCMN